jgi:hypothetical protein
MVDIATKNWFRSQCRAYDEVSLRTLGAWAGGPDTDPALRLEAMKLLFAYGHKKPGASRTKKEHSGTINVVLRHINEGKAPGEK